MKTRLEKHICISVRAVRSTDKTDIVIRNEFLNNENEVLTRFESNQSTKLEIFAKDSQRNKTDLHKTDRDLFFMKEWFNEISVKRRKRKKKEDRGESNGR